MPTASAERPALAPPDTGASETADDRLLAVYNCGRLGMRANPPRRSLLDLFRFGRWR